LGEQFVESSVEADGLLPCGIHDCPVKEIRRAIAEIARSTAALAVGETAPAAT
jgi:hypothetical protein